jgi:hypothetical protein
VLWDEGEVPLFPGGGRRPWAAGVEPPDLAETVELLVEGGGAAEEEDPAGFVVVDDFGVGEVGGDDGDAVVVVEMSVDLG